MRRILPRPEWEPPADDRRLSPPPVGLCADHPDAQTASSLLRSATPAIHHGRRTTRRYMHPTPGHLLAPVQGIDAVLRSATGPPSAPNQTDTQSSVPASDVSPDHVVGSPPSGRSAAW